MTAARFLGPPNYPYLLACPVEPLLLDVFDDVFMFALDAGTVATSRTESGLIIISIGCPCLSLARTRKEPGIICMSV